MSAFSQMSAFLQKAVAKSQVHQQTTQQLQCRNISTEGEQAEDSVQVLLHHSSTTLYAAAALYMTPHAPHALLESHNQPVSATPPAEAQADWVSHSLNWSLRMSARCQELRQTATPGLNADFPLALHGSHTCHAMTVLTSSPPEAASPRQLPILLSRGLLIVMRSLSWRAYFFMVTLPPIILLAGLHLGKP